VANVRRKARALGFTWVEIPTPGVSLATKEAWPSSVATCEEVTSVTRALVAKFQADALVLLSEDGHEVGTTGECFQVCLVDHGDHEASVLEDLDLL